MSAVRSGWRPAARTPPQITAPTKTAGTLRNAIADCQVSDIVADAGFEDIAAFAAEVCATSMAGISLTQADRQWCNSGPGIGLGETFVEPCFCPHTMACGELFVVPDATRDDRFSTNRVVTGSPKARFYAGVPLVGGDGMTIGTLFVLDQRPRRSLDEVQQHALHILAEQVVIRVKLGKRMPQRHLPLAA